MLAEAARIAIDQNRRVADVLAGCGLRVPSFQALPAAPPLCFLHIPKTGGASAIQWLETMFAAREVAPCRNAVDFEQLAGARRSYRLFAGHFHGRQAGLFPEDAQWLTIVRDPVEAAVSAYHHRRLAPANDWERDRRGLAEGDALRGDDRLDKARAGEMTSLFQRLDLRAALEQRLPCLRPAFRDTLARQLGANAGEDCLFNDLADDAPALHDMRQRQWRRAQRLLDEIDVVGEHGALDEALRLVAAVRGWPAPPALGRIHDFGAPTRADAAIPELRRRLTEYSPIDERIFNYACRRAATGRARLQALCGGTAAADVDAAHRQRVFRETRRVCAFDVAADEAWNGCGWGLRQRDGHGNAYREFADGLSGSTLMRLDPSISEYRLFAHVWDAATQAALEGLAARVGDAPLERVACAWRSGALIVEWRLPATLVRAARGNVECVFSKDVRTRADRLAIARIGCVPAAAPSGSLPAAA